MRWANPPGGSGDYIGAWKWSAETAELRSQPRRWAVIWEEDITPDMEGYHQSETDRNGENLRAGIAYGRLKAFQPRGDYESVKRKEKNGKGFAIRVYARYVGDLVA